VTFQAIKKILIRSSHKGTRKKRALSSNPSRRLEERLETPKEYTHTARRTGEILKDSGKGDQERKPCKKSPSGERERASSVMARTKREGSMKITIKKKKKLLLPKKRLKRRLGGKNNSSHI